MIMIMIIMMIMMMILKCSKYIAQSGRYRPRNYMRRIFKLMIISVWYGNNSSTTQNRNSRTVIAAIFLQHHLLSHGGMTLKIQLKSKVKLLCASLSCLWSVTKATNEWPWKLKSRSNFIVHETLSQASDNFCQIWMDLFNPAGSEQRAVHDVLHFSSHCQFLKIWDKP